MWQIEIIQSEYISLNGKTSKGINTRKWVSKTSVEGGVLRLICDIQRVQLSYYTNVVHTLASTQDFSTSCICANEPSERQCRHIHQA